MKFISSPIGQAARKAGRKFSSRNLVAVAGLMLAAQLSAQTMTSYVQTLPGKGSKCRIQGTSSIHDWNMETPIIAGTFEVDAKADFDKSKPSLEGVKDGKLPAKASIRIPVRTLKSYNAKMDEVYKQHMDESKFKNIEYKLAELAVKADRKAGSPFEFTSKGELTIHGTKKAVEIPVTIEALEDNQLKIVGKTPIKMTDFGVKPPNPKLPVGEITTGDDITVTFEWVVQKKK